MVSKNKIKQFKRNKKAKETESEDDGSSGEEKEEKEDKSDDKLDFSGEDDKCVDWRASWKKKKMKTTRYPSSTFTGVPAECRKSYQEIMKHVMKTNSAYRHAQRKITHQATMIRRLMTTDNTKGYWSFVREGGCDKFLEFMSKGNETNAKGVTSEKEL